MDVLVERVGNASERSVYREPTFTGLYTRWNSFTATSHKINLVKSLTSHAKRICTPARLEAEIMCLKGLFVDNGYPSGLVSRLVQQMLETASLHGAGKKDEGVEYVSLRLPWIGPVSERFRKDV